MSRLSYKASYYVLYAIFAVIIVILGLFYFGGDATGSAILTSLDPGMKQPAHLDTLMYLVYTLLVVTVLVTLVGSIIKFGGKLKDAPKEAVRSIIGLVIFVALFLICYSLGDGTPLKITGYDGSDNVSFWLKITDMFLYIVYIEMALAVLLIILFGVRRRFLK
ncbi:MAG: hypothetical protein WCR45_04115 [Bacteroidaceae bacterium]|nr:hypothetical protein [Bacteroidaceae bacterium]